MTDYDICFGCKMNVIKSQSFMFRGDLLCSGCHQKRMDRGITQWWANCKGVRNGHPDFKISDFPRLSDFI